jgi:septal ring factor EnvC (AmiA/AmiB activator)
MRRQWVALFTSGCMFWGSGCASHEQRAPLINVETQVESEPQRRSAHSSDEEVRRLKRDLGKERRRVASLEDKIDDLRSDNRKLENELEECEDRLDDLDDRYDDDDDDDDEDDD